MLDKGLKRGAFKEILELVEGMLKSYVECLYEIEKIKLIMENGFLKYAK